METYYFYAKTYTSHKLRIIVPKEVYPAFHKVQTIWCGVRSNEIEVMTHQKDEDTLYLSSQLKDELKLPDLSTLSCSVEGANIWLQPLLGIFTAGFTDNQEAPIGERTAIFEAMSITGQSYGFDTVVFGYQHVNLEDETINGYVFHNGVWERKTYPFPYVIYDRIPNRKIEHHPLVIRMRKQLQSRTIWFNSGFFNKWKVYDRLKRTYQVSHLLPQTTLHPSPERVLEMLQQEKKLYIKPIHGSKGTGIKRCRLREETGEIECQYYEGEKLVHQRYQDGQNMINQQFPNGLFGYIVQPEIELKTKRSTPMDYRVHTNKNEKNEWVVTAICTKFAGKGSLTTHVRRGGSLHTLEELFDDRESQQVYTKLERCALEISQVLDRTLKGPLGEIGFDFGIDQEGQVWMFEANSKPGYALYDHPTFKREQNVILSYPYRYAKYLYQKRITQHKDRRPIT
ncbi:hypothetical protein N780_07300 [Pontibacillus chungwhensis BH030062]|uniref:ATP-grasp domain-containing protein n=1 Tax=Pontibacillus chungwhensis BH030062 TaxID=1385513 RepID=A0A0A2V8H8_9BACI|nr:YheC/YheD family protein [Pontibacillus chungwhensis]KGP90025.1 hypothetical protein N780_07300 [Pontibacillus chungwhensis BH030062]